MERTFNNFVAAYSSQDAEKLVSLFTDDCVYEDVAFGIISHGKEELRAFAKGAFSAFPDMKIDVKSLFISGDRAAAEWVWSGTHKGDFLGYPSPARASRYGGPRSWNLKEAR